MLRLKYSALVEVVLALLVVGEWEIVTEKHSSLTDKCFPSGSADSYAALAGKYK